MSKKTKKQTNHHPDNPPTTPPPPGIGGPEIPPEQHQPPNSHPKSNEGPNRVLIGLTGGLVFFAAIQAAVYYCTLTQISRQADSADKSLVVMGNAVAVAKTANEIARDVAGRQEKFAKIETRAYITIGSFASHDFVVGKQMKVTLNISNEGRTPATNVRTLYTLKFGTGIFPHEIGRIESGVGSVHDKGTIGAGATNTIPSALNRTMSETDLRELTSGQKAVFFFGKITYSDIFGERHATRFSYQYVPPDQFTLTGNYWDAD